MRKIIVNNNEVIIDEVDDRRKCRNVDADVVGYQHDSKTDYDIVGHEEITSGTTLKIETTPDGQELHSGSVKIGDTVYWGIKKAQELSE